MKTYVLSENLQEKLPFINRAVSLKGQLPILSNILLQARKGKLQIDSTDLEIGIQVSVAASTEEDGETTVPAKTFSDLVSVLANGKILLQTEKNNLVLTGSKVRSVFQTMSAEEFPRLYEEKGQEVVRILGTELERQFSKVIFAASLDTVKPALSGIYVKKEGSSTDGFTLVATDGYRLSLKQGKTKQDSLEKPLLIPARVLKEVLGLKDKESEFRVFVSEKNNQVMFEQNDTVLIGRLIDEKFPAYEKIIPSDFLTRVVFDKEEMQRAVKTCAIFARESANIIRLAIKKDTVVVSANTPSVGENTVEVEAKITGDENEIAFNGRYLLEFLANMQEGDIVFEMTGPLNPGVFRTTDDPSYLHIIMPIRVQTDG